MITAPCVDNPVYYHRSRYPTGSLSQALKIKGLVHGPVRGDPPKQFQRHVPLNVICSINLNSPQGRGCNISTLFFKAMKIKRSPDWIEGYIFGMLNGFFIAAVITLIIRL